MKERQHIGGHAIADSKKVNEAFVEKFEYHSHVVTTRKVTSTEWRSDRFGKKGVAINSINAAITGSTKSRGD